MGDLAPHNPFLTFTCHLSEAYFLESFLGVTREELSSIFQKLDKNEDGCIDAAEFKDGLEKLGLSVGVDFR